MDVANLDLSAAAWLCLGKLAMAVELDCGKRFAFRKAVAEIVGLLAMAEASVSGEIRQKRDEFLQASSPAMRRLMVAGLEETGLAPGEVGAAGAEVPERRYRGAKVVEVSEAEAPAAGAVDEGGRKRIVYRGRVIYV